jgi:hypothetical protein
MNEKYKSIDSSEDLISRLLRDFKNHEIDSSQVMSHLSEMNLLQEKPLVKTIQDHVMNYLKFPKGGVWLQELVTIYKPSYLSNISAFRDAEISFKQFIEDNIHHMKDFQSIFPEQKDKDIFWKMIDLLSDELNKV